MLEALMTPIDIYCERAGSAFWAEPLNAASNIAFVIAGLWGVRAARRLQAGGFAELLGWWVVAIGVGSGLFHTFANRLTIWADVLPIAGFTLAYTIFALRHFLELGWGRTLAAFGGFHLAAGLLTAMVPEWRRAASNGSTGYLPAFLALVVFGAAMLARGKRAGWFCLAAAAIFTLSLAFRRSTCVSAACCRRARISSGTF